MLTLVQRVTSAEVCVAGEIVGRIDGGLLALVGVDRGDTEADAVVTARKLGALRIFAGRTPMDLSLQDVGGACLVVSQFTLSGSIHKGNRPSFDSAEAPGRAEHLYLHLVETLRTLGVATQTGRFAADMQVRLVNDGPVTFVIEVRGGFLVRRPTEATVSRP